MRGNNKISSFLRSKSNVILAWIGVFLFFFLSFWSGLEISLLHSLFLTLSLMFASFIESKYVVKLLQTGHPFLFYIVNVVLVIVMSGITIHMELMMLKVMGKYFPIDVSLPKDMSLPNNVNVLFIPVLVRVVLYVATVAISVITVLQRADKESHRVKNELKSEKLDMELRFLKSQITPHFLFNALNNIYSLVYTKDERAPQSLLKLSDMLRYVMVDCQVDMISLDKEIKYIDAFIDFQQMSMENRSNVIFEKDVKNHEFKIPPMILQPLVENSFKHSRLVNDPNGFVHFYLLQDNENLLFIARNSLKEMSVSLIDPNKKQQQGIGLSNVRKRLELYYGKKYSFEVKQEDDCYVATIKIGDMINEKKV